MEQAESERETEFGLMKEVIKKVVYALEDKASTDLIASTSAVVSPSPNETSNSFLTGGNNTFHKRQGSLPPPEILNRTNR